MSSPARAMGSAATPPMAPRPMMTTSVCLSRVAMDILETIITVVTSCRGPVEHRVVVRRLVIGRQRDAHLLLVGGHDRANAGIAEEIPADEVVVAAVKRIAKRALNGVRAHEREEGRRFDLVEDGVLIGGRERRERHAAHL